MLMSYYILNDLEPKNFFKWFGAISQIPRGSGNEREIMDFIMDFAVRRGYPCERDSAGNVFVTVSGTPGYEHEPPVLLQAHVDMVWEKKEDVVFDFETEPLRLKIQNDRLMAEGTSLGADNAVGVATMLALADSHNIVHPPLELLFTVEEEIGLIGIRKFDMSRIRARRMLNMDCGSIDTICVSSAGSVRFELSQNYSVYNLPEGYRGLELKIGGGRGGHSAIMINKGRMCAVNSLAALIQSSSDHCLLASLSVTGSAILDNCSAVLALPENRYDEILSEMIRNFEIIKALYAEADPDIYLSLEAVETKELHFLSAEISKDLISILGILRTGPYRYNAANPDDVITSASITGLSLDKGSFHMTCVIRSSSDIDADNLFHNFRSIAEKFGLHTHLSDRYPGWPEKMDSGFRDLFRQAYVKMTGREPIYERIHGGVEIGIIAGAIPDMDAVGYAPTSHGAHTADEYLLISTVQPFWDVLTDVLSKKEKT